MNREGSNSMMTKTPIILARQDKRADPPTVLPSPGAISIMQREPSGSHLPTSPPIHTTTSSSGNFPSHGEHLPPSSSSSHHPQSIPQVMKSSREEGKGRNQRRQENTTSSPSSYIPLQPGIRGGARGESSGGHSRTSTDHSVFLNQASEMNHSVKVIDKNLHWEDKGMDVSKSCGGYVIHIGLGEE